MATKPESLTGIDAVIWADATAIYDTAGEEVNFPMQMPWGRPAHAQFDHVFLLGTAEVSTSGFAKVGYADPAEGAFTALNLHGTIGLGEWLKELNQFRDTPFDEARLLQLGTVIHHLATEDASVGATHDA